MDDYDIGLAFKKIEDELIASMIRNIERHAAEETEEGYNWTMWQTEQLKALEIYRRSNLKKFSPQFQVINSSIERALKVAKNDGRLKQEASILRAMKKGLKVKKSDKGATAEFFHVNERKLNALIQSTTNDMQKAETAVLRYANDQYRKIIFNAQVYANTGAGTYKKAVDMATKDFLRAGINCIEYKNGSRHTIAEYADMAIRTASKRAYLQGEGEMRKEWGISTVIMNKRGNPCPKCLPFVGKVMIDDVWSGGKSTDGPYMLMSTAISKGLYHPRCKDSHTTYFPGISSEGVPYTEEEKQQVADRYNAEQKENYAKNQAEKYGRMAKYSLDEDNKRVYAARKEQWNKISRNYEKGYANKGTQREGTNAANLEYINSEEYARKFDKISKDKELNSIIYSKALELLRKNNNSDTEGLCILSVINKHIILNVQGEKDALGVKLSEKQIAIIKNSKTQIIGIHNHPTNLMPNGSDFVAAGYRGYKYGIVVTHDGRIYKYSVGDKPFLPVLLDNRIDKYCSKEYNLSIGEAYERALNEFRKEYGISWQEIK